MLLFTIVFVILAGFEIYLRLTEPQMLAESGQRLDVVSNQAGYLVLWTTKGRRMIPNARVIIRNHYISGSNVRVNTNSLGFRDDELAQGKADNEVRILVLGDSITFGSYLPGEQTFVERTEDYLSRNFPGVKIEVINGGIPDVGLEDEINILEERGLSLLPDMVVVAFYLNDSRPPWNFSQELAHVGWLERHSLLALRLFRYLRMKKWLKAQGEERFAWGKALNSRSLDWKRRREDFLHLASLAKYDWGAAWQKDSWEIIDREFGRLRELSLKHDFDVTLVVFPVSFQVLSEFLEDGPQDLLREKANRFGFRYLDVLPRLRKYRKDLKSIYFDHCHLTARGNDLVGYALSGFIKKQMLSNEEGVPHGPQN